MRSISPYTNETPPYFIEDNDVPFLWELEREALHLIMMSTELRHHHVAKQCHILSIRVRELVSEASLVDYIARPYICIILNN